MDESVPIFQQRVGPLGLDIPPAGNVTFEEIVDGYRRRLTESGGPVHIDGMRTMAECRAAILAAGEKGCGPLWVSWDCNKDGESPARVHMLAALFVAEGMGAAAFGLNCSQDTAECLLAELAQYAAIPLFRVEGTTVIRYDYIASEQGPDVIPCATGSVPCFVTRTVDVGDGLECTPDLLEDIIAAENDPVGAMKISILEQDDIDAFAQEQYAVSKALCLWSDVPELLEGALRVYQGRAFYDGTGDLEPADLERMSRRYGLIIL